MTALVAVVALVAAAPSARAEPPAGAPIALVVFGDDLPRDELRARLERAVGHPITLADGRDAARAPTVTVTWHRDRAELAVSYDEPPRGTVSRVVHARALATENVDDAVLLATTLVRDEADELLGKRPEPPTATPPVAGAAAAPAAPTLPPLRARDEVPAYASFFHPLATNWSQPYARTRLGLDLPYGRAGELASGLQLGFVNVVSGGDGQASGDASGVQLGGVDYASGRLSGMQIAFVGNVAGGGAQGGQIAVAGNVSGGDVDGAQIAAGVNVGAGTVRGAQVASVNVAGDVHGAQVGLLNVAKKVDGVMLGLINVADDVDGVPIGLVSVTRTGGVHPIAWASTETYANVGVKFATRHTYTMIAAHYGVAPADTIGAVHVDERQFVGGGFFVGGHVPIDHAFVDVDLGFSSLLAPSRSYRVDAPAGLYHESLLEPRLRAIVGYAIADHASLFLGGGAALRIRLVNDGADALVRPVPELLGGIQL